MNHREIAALMKGIAPVVRDFVAKAVSGLVTRVDALEARVPVRVDPDPVAIAQLIASEVAKIPPAPPGKDVDPAEVALLVANEVEKVVGALPKPSDGKDADPALIAQLVATEVTKIPPAPAGKDADPAAIRLMVAEEVAKVPPASNGKDVDPALIAQLVAAEVAKIPPAPAGKDADPELVLRLTETVDRLETEIKTLTGEIADLRALPIAPASFLVDEAGELRAVYPDGTTTTIGRVHGEDGKAGAAVMDGHVDDGGLLVLRMSDGRHVKAGLVRGEPGKPATPGEPGRPGRDAFEIRIIPGIDESKSYAEGICARYRGGVIRAERETDPIENGDIAKAGWGVILEGIAEEAERPLDDGRILERTTTYTSGKSFTRKIKTALPIYRGVWKEGPYERGDQVTRDGSQWHAEKDTTAMPGMSPDWKLCVKRGRDGKPGKNGDPGKPGEPGKPGRDLTQVGFDGSRY